MCPLSVSGCFQFSGLFVSDSLRPHESQHARPPCPSPTPGVYSVESVIPSSHLILCLPLLPLSTPPGIRVFFQWVSSAWGGQSIGTEKVEWGKKMCKVKVKSLGPVRLCDPVDCSLPGSSILGIFQTRILEWIAISFSIGFSRPRDWTQVSLIVGRRFTIWATREVRKKKVLFVIRL